MARRSAAPLSHLVRPPGGPHLICYRCDLRVPDENNPVCPFCGSAERVWWCIGPARGRSFGCSHCEDDRKTRQLSRQTGAR